MYKKKVWEYGNQWSWKSSQKTYFINIFVLLISNYVPKMSTLNECARACVYTCLYMFCF